ncbi:MAG: hypothetical protein OXN91_01385 [Chloroflexota bacterium]|nr:hypothetical protein [Chloroflexota bacterium]
MSQGESAGEASERDGQLHESRPETFRHLNTSHRHYNDPIAGIHLVMGEGGGFSPIQPDTDVGSLFNQGFDPYVNMAFDQYLDIFRTLGLPTPTEVDLISRHTDKFFGAINDFIPTNVRQAADHGLAEVEVIRSALGWSGDRLNDLGTWAHQSLSSLLPGTDYSLSKSWDPGLHMELNEFHRTLDEVAPSADQATQATGRLWDSVDELDDGVGALGGTVDLATLGMDDMSASMGVGRQEALALTGDLGMLEAQGLSTVEALQLLAAMPRMPAGAGGWGPPTGGVAHADPGLTRREAIEAERQRILNMPPPADLEDLFLSQREMGHNISLYASPEAWWTAHKQELANQLPSYASGTHFAPGGMALVGEMGPELVNLPRGSQVIPDPQLGSAVTVNVTVEGSVVAERDLAQRIRQELIRTSRRTVDLGFN